MSTHQPCTSAFASVEPRAGRGDLWRLGSAALSKLIVAGLLLPELPALICYQQTHSLALFRGWINVEYLLLFCLGILFPSWPMIVLLTAELAISLVEPIAHLYYFSPRDMLWSLQYLIMLPRHRLVWYGCLLAAYVVGCAGLLRATLGLRRFPWSRQLALVLLGCSLLPALADFYNGYFHKILGIGPRPSDVESGASRAMRLPTVSLAWWTLKGVGHPGEAFPAPLPSTLGAVLGALPADSRPDIVLVLTESWGIASDDRINQAEERPYRSSSIARLYRVETGMAHFQGATTSGETRELCGDSTGYVSVSFPEKYFDGCWPARLESEGYHTIATHGFTPTMFNREAWYRRFGFQQTAFLPELSRAGVGMCDGAFPGACDAGVAAWIGDRLVGARDQRPIFVHWVTLNSHLPNLPLSGNRAGKDCSAVGVEGDEALCSWFEHVLIVHNSVAELAARPGLRPTVFVVIGDHAPPFLRADLRNRFSQTSVPYVALIPRFSTLQTASLSPPKVLLRAGRKTRSPN